MAVIRRPVPCRSCGAPVLWVETVNAKLMPLDAEPLSVEAGGNIRLEIPPEGAVYQNGMPMYPLGRVRTRGELGISAVTGEALYRSHFATCPNAAAHRKRQGRS